jgi:hypothetical protein
MDAFSLFPRRGGVPTWIQKFGLGACIGIGLMFQSVQAQSCNCVESNYYASEPLPLVSFVTTCPAWPANHWLPPVRGVNTAGPLVASYRGELFLSARTIPYADEAMSTIDVVVQGKKDICQGVTRVGDQALSGWNIVILNHWYTPGPSTGGRNPMPTFKKLDRNILATLPAPVFFPIEDAEAAQVRSFFDAEGQGLAPVIPGLALAPFAGRYRLRAVPTMGYLPEAHRQGSRAPRGTVITTDLMKDIRQTLTQNGWNQFYPGMVQVNGEWVPAILKLFGKPGKVFAYYGRFKSGEEARRYGHTPADELYFSKRDLVPTVESEIFQTDLRYGSQIFLREEVEKNRRFLEWHKDCRCSELPFVPDDRNHATVDGDGSYTPIAPDNPENGNALLFRQCPDERTYFSLYQQCVEAELKEDKIMADPRGRVDYSDHFASEMGETPVYKSMNPDGTLDAEGLSVDQMPETPAYYNKQGDRLNPSKEDLMDPLDPNTVFFGYRYGPKAWDDWEGSKEKQFRINPRIRVIVTDMQSFFESVVSKGKEPLLDLFNIRFEQGQTQTASDGAKLPEAAPGPVRVQATYRSLSLDLTVQEPTAFGRPMRILNSSDKYLEYKSARTFIVNSLTGRPLKIHRWTDEAEVDDFVLGDDLDDLKFRVYWLYGLYAYDRRGDPVQVGTLRISNTFWRNADENAMKLVGKWTSEVGMEGGKLISSADVYDLASREAHTDLKSLDARDEVTFSEKGEAMARIAYYIAVSEGLDMAMKWIYNQKDRPYLYEAAKRLENMVAVKQSAKVAYTFYKGYIEWRRLMDILAEIRDSRRALERAYSRFKRSGSLLVDHFVNLDYSKIRPTNVASVYPTRAMRYFDWSAQELRNELLHFEASLHALNLDLDRFMDGPGKRTLAYLYRETAGPWAQVTAENDRDRDKTHGALKGAQAALSKDGDNTSNYIRLSSLTRLAIQKTKNTEVKSLEASTSGLRNVLMAIQSDSRDWLTMQDYVTLNLAGSPGAFRQSYRNRDPAAVARQFDVHPIFRNTWVDDKLEEEVESP